MKIVGDHIIGRIRKNGVYLTVVEEKYHIHSNWNKQQIALLPAAEYNNI